MSDFCRIHDTEYGQLVVLMGDNVDGKPEVRFLVQPSGFGICSMAASFSDDEAGWRLQDAAFAKADKEFSINFLRPLFANLDIADDRNRKSEVAK